MDQNIKLEGDENCPESEENINEELYQKTLAENEIQEEYSSDASEFCMVYIEEELTDDQSDHNLNAWNIPLDNIKNEFIREEQHVWDVEASILNILNEKKIINNANKANRVKNEKLFECQYCEYVAKRKVNLEYHLLKHANIKLFKCELCNHECNHRGNMKKHMLTHTKTKLLYCKICEYGCNDARCMKAHMLNHKDPILYISKEYNHETNLKGSLDKPILTHLKDSKCPDSLEHIPKKNYEKYLSLVQSIQSSPKEFKCLKCDFSCNEKWELDIHELGRHCDKIFKCSLCSYESDRKKNLKRHFLTHNNKRIVDSESKRFQCSECPYRCTEKRYLQQHMLTHSSVKLFRCSQCDYQCNRKYSLQVHNTKHTNSKLYQCPLCSFGCNYKAFWKNHLLKKHSAV